LTIPIVFAVVADPIGSGFAPSLARPGGNITGFTYVEPTTDGKWVGLLKEISPRTAHVALLFNPATTPQLKFYMPSIQAAASCLAIEANSAPVHAGVIAAQIPEPNPARYPLMDRRRPPQIPLRACAVHQNRSLYRPSNDDWLDAALTNSFFQFSQNRAEEIAVRTFCRLASVGIGAGSPGEEGG
jgi:hypothetical protein